MFHFPRITWLAVAMVVAVASLGCHGPGGLTESSLEESIRAFRDQVRTDIEDNPVILDKIGTIRSFEVDVDASEELPGENDFVFNVSGSKGSGVMTATCITIDDFTEDVTAGTLKLSSGETVDMFPQE